ncbi:hypothetical protein [uncultured Aquimarina sp.]|uniref:hypothetical protein n=1 Tax=uncultured Aquimarina sp. TaxID=575652 RepID=UPI002625681B|nr:hypothetical protein [uncultured Aquimarina sp.]
MKNNILRQITDIQVQADRLISEKANLEEIEQFSQYSQEIKTFLLNTVKDEFVKKYVLEIPDLDLDSPKNSSKAKSIIAIIIGGIGGSYYNEKRKIDEALDTLKDIRNKYASAEFMLKNYFN